MINDPKTCLCKCEGTEISKTVHLLGELSKLNVAVAMERNYIIFFSNQ